MEFSGVEWENIVSHSCIFAEQCHDKTWEFGLCFCIQVRYEDTTQACLLQPSYLQVTNVGLVGVASGNNTFLKLYCSVM